MFRWSSNGIQAGNCGGHFGFPIRTNLPFLDQQFTQILPTKFQVNWPFGSGEEGKIDFQNGCHIWFPIKTILAILYLQVTPMLPIKFRVNWHFGSGEEGKNGFSRWPPWRPSWTSDRNDFSFFDLHVTLMLPTKFRVSWSRGIGGLGF